MGGGGDAKAEVVATGGEAKTANGWIAGGESALIRALIPGL